MNPRTAKTVAFLALLAAAAVIGWLRQGGDAWQTDAPPAVPEATTPTPSRPTAAPARTPAARSDLGFRSRAQLVDHFNRHGREFGAATAEAYLKLAQALRDAPAGGAVLEAVRPVDGVTTRFDRRSGAFLAANADGTIRTFFRPDDGEAYFRRQQNRPPEDSR